MNVANTFHIDNRATIVDQSVNQAIWADGDVTQVFDQKAVLAAGDDSVAAGRDATLDNSQTDVTTGDIAIGNKEQNTEVTDSFNDESTDVTADVQVTDSFNDGSTGSTTTDTATDSSNDEGTDTTTDPGTGSSTDTSADTSVDAPADTSVDAPADTSVEAPADTSSQDSLQNDTSTVLLTQFDDSDAYSEPSAPEIEDTPIEVEYEQS
jgi:hypothetical protein